MFLLNILKRTHFNDSLVGRNLLLLFYFWQNIGCLKRPIGWKLQNHKLNLNFTRCIFANENFITLKNTWLWNFAVQKFWKIFLGEGSMPYYLNLTLKKLLKGNSFNIFLNNRFITFEIFCKIFFESFKLNQLFHFLIFQTWDWEYFLNIAMRKFPPNWIRSLYWVLLI